MKKIILVSILFAQSAFAGWNNPTNKTEEMKIVNKIVKQNSGFDLARTYVKANGETTSDATADSYIFMDMNKDGGKDLVVIVEKTICWDEDVSLTNCTWPDIGAEGRKLLIYFGQWNGTYKKVGKSASAMLNQGDGGVAAAYGDPLLPMSVESKSDSLVISYWGGSNQKWSFDFKIKYMQVPGNGYGFYLTHRKATWMEWASVHPEEPVMNLYEETHNLVTGKKVLTREPLFEEEVKATVITDVIEKSPLKRFSQLGVGDFFTTWVE